MMQTLKYKGAYIHINDDKVTVQIFHDSTGNFFTKEVKSFRAAQIFITRWFK